LGGIIDTVEVFRHGLQTPILAPLYSGRRLPDTGQNRTKAEYRQRVRQDRYEKL